MKYEVADELIEALAVHWVGQVRAEEEEWIRADMAGLIASPAMQEILRRSRALALCDWADEMESRWADEPPKSARVWDRIIYTLSKPAMTVVVQATRGRAAWVERGEDDS